MTAEKIYKSTEADRTRARRSRQRDPEKALEYGRAYYWANREVLLAKNKVRAKANPEQAKRRQERYVERNKARIAARYAEYAERNKEKIASAKRRYNEKRRSTAAGKLNDRISAQIRSALGRGGKGGQSAAKLVGWSVVELMEHLERQFLRGMAWGNMGDWQIDHIVPLAEFEKAEPFDIRAAWALTNLRPLWAEQNRTKGGRREHLL